MNHPHRFEEIISGNTPPLLLAGAGLSYPNVQTKKIVPFLREAPESASCKDPAKCLGLDSKIDNCIYCLAEQRLVELGEPQLGHEHPRFALANRMTLFNDEMWLGK